MRWLFRILLTLVTLVILGFGAILLIPGDRVAQVAVTKFKEITGRDLVIEGAVSPTLWPVLGVSIGQVSIANAPWSDAGPMLTAEEVRIGVDAMALIGGEVKIAELRATNPVILLERSADGAENWVVGGDNGGTAQAGMAGDGTPFTLDLAQVSGGAFTFVDHGAGTTFAATDLDVTMRVPSFEGAAEVQVAGQVNGAAVAVDLQLSQFKSFLEGRVIDLTATAELGGGTASFEGRAGWNPLEAAGKLQSDIPDMAAALRLAGAEGVALPQGLGAERVAVAGDITVTAERSVFLRAGSVTLDSNDLTVDADLVMGGERPKLSAKVQAGNLSLAAAAGGGGSGGGAAGGGGWSKAAIDVAGLEAMDANIAFSASGLDLGTMRFGAVQANIAIDRARAVVDIARAEAYGGAIAGQVVVNGRGGLSSAADLNLSGLSMETLLSDLAGYTRLSGTGDLSINLITSGASMDGLMRNVSGAGRMTLGKGEIKGFDLAGMITNLDAGFVGEGQSTVFDGVTATFTIDGGVLSNNDLALTAPFVSAKGEGTVDIGGQMLDYGLSATALANAETGAAGITVPVRITGPWANPQIGPDLEALARQKFEADAKALEEQAKAAAAQALQDELGVTQQEGESLEDTAKRGLEQKLQEEGGNLLQNLFGGGNN